MTDLQTLVDQHALKVAVNTPDTYGGFVYVFSVAKLWEFEKAVREGILADIKKEVLNLK